MTNQPWTRQTSCGSGRRSRREFLHHLVLVAGGVGLGAPLLAACQPAAAPPPAKPAEAAKPTQAAKPAAPAASAATAAPAAKSAEAGKPTQAAPAAAKPSQTLIWGAGSAVEITDPHKSTNSTDLGLFDNLYDFVVHRAPDGSKLEPRLATEWKITEANTWQFKLRSGVKWHNGDPFTAEDVQYSIMRTKDPAEKTRYGANFSHVTRVDVVDPLTVNVVTQNPDPLLPSRLAVFGSHVVPMKYLKSVGPEEFAKKPVGTGPYKFVEMRTGDRIVLEANPEYFGGAPQVTRLEIRGIPEASSRINALLNGEVNFADQLPSDQMARVDASQAARVVKADPRSVTAFLMQAGAPGLKIKGVRQALSLALDREKLMGALMKDLARPVNSYVVPGDFGYEPERPPIPFDPQKARDILKSSGYANEDIIVETPQSSVMGNEGQLAEAAVAMWKDVGLNAKVEVIEAAVRSKKINDGSFKGLFITSSLSALFDADGLLYRVVSKTGPTPNLGWDHPEFERLGLEARGTTDMERRKEIYKRLSDIVLDEVPVVPLWAPLQPVGVARSLEWTPGPGFEKSFRAETLKVTS